VNAAHRAVLRVEFSFADGGAEGKDVKCTEGWADIESLNQ
jgi:hypothetical protein